MRKKEKWARSPLRMVRRFVVLALVVAACGGAVSTSDSGERADLPSITVDEFEARLSATDRPAVVNVWASWCLPCRSEAPLLNQAADQYGEKIEFIGVDVADTQTDAKAFLNEFGLNFDHFFDPDRAIPNHYAGIGTPITFFFGPGGELLATHNGVVDERTLALNIDELLRLG